ncbi:YciI-like protein [Microbacterium sp. 8M]|uniref:YciI family protein n=1 Tax=Microbacterium sp. 8M TaxID=2653153 RepID=UPI0012EF1ED0|nr:YciI family protein [Microbacterium sp. 8M]VXC00351.1 YciI-like protein [Microbacterium sp. 8M]
MDVVVLYRLREGADRARILEVFPRHQAYYRAFHEAGGGVIALGPFATPDPAAGSMGVFSTRHEAERFIAEDPFVTEGLADPRILDWNAVWLDGRPGV